MTVIFISASVIIAKPLLLLNSCHFLNPKTDAVTYTRERARPNGTDPDVVVTPRTRSRYRNSRPRDMSWRQDRANEASQYAPDGSKHRPDTIVSVIAGFDNDDDWIFLFDTGAHRYGIVVVVSKPRDLNWKECQAIADGMNVSARGTTMNHQVFQNCLESFSRKFGRADGPIFRDGRMIGVVYPGQGSVSVKSDDTLVRTKIAFDNDGDVVIQAITRKRLVYRVCIQLTLKENRFTELDCKAFVDVVGMLEVGDEVPENKFLAYGVILKTRYNIVKPGRTEDGRLINYNVLATNVKNDEVLPPLFVRAALRLVDESHSKNDDRASSSQLSCPYPGITYTRALKGSGQAQVYAGKRGSTDVAIKVFSDGDDQTTAYKSELRLLLKMSRHKNVVHVIDFFETPKPALVMELIEGCDLMDYLRDNGAMSQEEGLQFAIGIAEGLCHLHRHGIIHRDLKTANILRRSDGVPVIIDLGLSSMQSRRVDTDEIFTGFMSGALVEDRTTAIKGTVLWMAPEMITERSWSDKTDVYAFGIILWELLSGKDPTLLAGENAHSAMSLLVAIASGRRPPMSAISHVDAKTRALIQQCWNQDPRKRPSMRRVLDILNSNDPKRIFDMIDTNRSGTLDFPEFVQFLNKYAPNKVPPVQMFPLFDVIDIDHSGDITLDEFLNFWRQVEIYGLEHFLQQHASVKKTEARDDEVYSRPHRSNSSASSSNMTIDFEKVLR